MANKNPRLENLKPFKPKGDKPLSKKPLNIRIDQEDYDLLMSLPRDIRLNLVRQAIKEGLEELQEEKVNSLVYG